MENQTINPEQKSDRNFVAMLLLCFFLGSLGVHRFYAGKIGTGILMLITIGGLGIWTIIDFIMIAVGSFKDKEGRYIKN
ncbi:TM2 domain-containing protein [Saccharicrinis sp. FJH62]|uniref:TM2 domain-containing protein n=1 Tax=Saccharicrinis sp. FJH62 TaxID=3344657 RepID=UPI0035D41895